MHMHIHMCVHIHIHINIHIHTHIRIHVHTFAHMHTCAFAITGLSSSRCHFSFLLRTQLQPVLQLADVLVMDKSNPQYTALFHSAVSFFDR